MRFSAVQEDGYGVGLGQETPPNDEDESMMAATGDVEPGGGCAIEEGSMISNLPLLFANGYPTSLEKITLPELERFVTFMVQCSLGHDKAEVISEPQWWPKEIKFSIPLVKPKKINENYMANLKKLVFRCYTYHRSEYLLRFCSYLAQYPHDKLEYVNNWDSTTSLYLKTNGKLLVTFRNENMNYDRKIVESRRMLLPLKKTKTAYSNSTKCLRRRSAQKQAPSPAMVEPPIEDIYLCDNCDAEFVGLGKMKEHEKLCYRVEPRPITPEAELAPEIQQDQFMEYFNLKSSNSSDPSRSGSSVVFSKDNTQNRTSSRIRSSVNLTRCPTIPFSSPAGLALGKKSKMMTESIQQERLERIERHLSAPPLSTSFKPKWFVKTYEFDRWTVTYKPNRDRTTKNDEYVHQYKFGNYSGKTVLDLRSQLLLVACKPIYVEVARLTDEAIEELKRDPSRYRSPERKIPRIRPRSPSVEPVDEPALSNKVIPIVIDLVDDDEEEIQQNRIVAVQPRPIPVPVLVPTPAPMPTPTTVLLPTFQPIVSSMPRVATVTPIRASMDYQLSSRSQACGPKQASKRLRSTKPIIYVDLCSSGDEEVEELEPETNPWCVSTDENCDPSTTFLRNSLLSPSKLCAKPCIYPADSTSGWLTNLNIDGESQCREQPFFKHNNILKSTP